MDFYKRIEPTSEDLIFREEGYYVWCGNLFRFGGACYPADSDDTFNIRFPLK